MIDRGEIPPDSSATDSSNVPSRRWTGGRWTLVGVVGLVLSQLVLRAWIASERGLFTDDVLYGSEVMVKPLFSADYLIDNRGGHFMPAAMLLHGGLYRLFPLEWMPFAVALMVLQVAACLAVVRLLRVLLGDRPLLLVPLAVYLFCPLSLGPFTWWAAAMNSLPLQIGLAWVVADAVLLMRTGRRRYAVSGTVALVITLLFYERAVLVPLFAFGLVAVLQHVDGAITPLRAAWQRGRGLWIASLVVLVAWAGVFVTAVPSESVGSATLTQIAALTRVSVESMVPALFGGPWVWFDGAGTPMAAPPGWTVALGEGVLLVLVAVTALRRRGAGHLWMLAGAYILVGALLVGAGRGSFAIAGLLPLAYRYFAAEAVVIPIVIALLFVLPRRAPTANPTELRVLLRAVAAQIGRVAAVARARRVAVPLLTIAFIASSLYSTVGYMRVWSTDPTKPYLAAAKASLAEAGDEPMLEWNVPEFLIWGLQTPWNRASMVFGPLEDMPEIADATHDLRQLDDEGRLRQAHVESGITVVENPAGGCGWQVTGGEGSVPLTAYMFNWAWTAELDYVANRDSTITMAMKSGEAVQVPLRRGHHTVYVRFVGEGDELRVTTETDGFELCFGSGVIGNMELD